MTLEEEITLLLPVVSHPAGFNVDMFGGRLAVVGTEDPNVWEVHQHSDSYYARTATFRTAEQAVRFFCVTRRRRQLGLEYERGQILSSDVGDMVNPHRPDPWITELSADQKTCRLLGHHCVADFPLTDIALAPLSWEILSKVEDIEVVLAKAGCDAINIGLYDGGRDIRVWPVHRR